MDEIDNCINRHARTVLQKAGKSVTNLEPQLKRWIFRILIELGAHRQFIEKYSFRDENLAQDIGLERWIDPADMNFDPKAVRNDLRKLYATEKRKSSRPSVNNYLAANIERLSSLVGLSSIDCQILEFVILLHNEQSLSDAADLLDDLSSLKVFNVLATILALPLQDVRNSLSPHGVLIKSGLVKVDRNGTYSLVRKLEVLSGCFADSICSLNTDPIFLLRDTISVCTPAELKIDDFEHLTSELKILRPYLRRSLSAGKLGVNILIHGQPGTGKSQLVRVLGEETDSEIFEVSSEDEDGDPIQGDRRLRAFRAAQSFCAKRRSLILFDEVEDVFSDSFSFMGLSRRPQTSKAWVNRMLEENPVPTFWLSNEIKCLDQAFIRRFDLVIELPVPPKKQRRQIVQQACSDFLSMDTINRLSESNVLAPAVVTRAAAVVRSIYDDLGTDEIDSAYERVVSNTLEAQGHIPIRRNDPNRLPETYDPEYIRADTDIARLAEGLAQTRVGRLCLYGPPGTGKTAYARWLSEQLGMPLVVKKASDLMSMFVGENERNIASAFRQAESEGAVLLIDEVDSFLQDRRGADKGWEVTLVNEMLTQMESYSGVFVASTNLMDGLDQAALRRFDLKVKFDYLSSDQAWRILKRYCDVLKIEKPETRQRSSMERLLNLTPGDFAVIMRRHRFQPVTSAMEMIGALQKECALKVGEKRAIGF